MRIQKVWVFKDSDWFLFGREFKLFFLKNTVSN